MLIYIGIFVCKVIEDALSTLRIIVVSNGKKLFGAILGFVIALIWVFVTGSVIIGLNENPFKIIVFALGSLVGSYVGSVIEEKIALGTNLFIVKISNNKLQTIYNVLKKAHYNVEIINKCTLRITSNRKETSNVTNLIYKYDKNAFIIAEKAKIISRHV